MRTFLKGTVVALALAGATLATAGTATADGYYDHGRVGVQVDLGNVVVGYRDGYWDRNHHWNRWRHRNDYRFYRGRQGATYNDWNHDRDGGDGWVQPAVGIQGGYGGPGVVQIDFGPVAFGYRDGYWDNGHQWHRWHNDGDYRNYRDHQGSNYHDWNHDRDHDMGWQR